jgi:uncharacterized membrane protein YagU involved in acid resistance
MRASAVTPPPPRRWWARHGLAGGLVAGVSFALFQMTAAAGMHGLTAFLVPLRMIGALVLGPEALAPGYSFVVAAVTGVAAHLVLSALFGTIFGWIAGEWSAVSRSLVVAATAYGLALWLVNYYVIAPAAGWTWFPRDTEPFVQAAAHAVFFGTVLGVYLDRSRAAAARTGIEIPRRRAA